jgi:hypothetical protein
MRYSAHVCAQTAQAPGLPRVPVLGALKPFPFGQRLARH